MRIVDALVLFVVQPADCAVLQAGPEAKTPAGTVAVHTLAALGFAFRTHDEPVICCFVFFVFLRPKARDGVLG